MCVIGSATRGGIAAAGVVHRLAALAALAERKPGQGGLDADQFVKMLEALLSGRFYDRARVQCVLVSPPLRPQKTKRRPGRHSLRLRTATMAHRWHTEPVFEGLMQDTVVAPIASGVTQCVLVRDAHPRESSDRYQQPHCQD